MIAKVRGKIIQVSDFVPRETDKGKAHTVISVLQLSEKGSDIIKVKDFDLRIPYAPGTDFESDCIIKNWTMGNKDGLTVSVFRGVQHDLPFGLSQGTFDPKIEKIKATI